MTTQRKTPRKAAPHKMTGPGQAPHGMTVRHHTFNRPANNLPPMVKDQAVERGYGDAITPLSLNVTQTDITKACDALAQGNGRACVMAQAGKRLGAVAIYFYRTSAWVDWGAGPIMRYITSAGIRNNIIKPFDNNDRVHIVAGIYDLKAPTPGTSLKRQRDRAGNRHGKGNKRVKMQFHTERVSRATDAV